MIGGGTIRVRVNDTADTSSTAGAASGSLIIYVNAASSLQQYSSYAVDEMHVFPEVDLTDANMIWLRNGSLGRFWNGSAWVAGA